MKTEALRAGAGQVRLRRRLRRRAARRGKEPRQGAHLLVPHAPSHALGPEEPAAGTLAAVTTPASTRANRSASFRSRTGPSSTSGNTSWPENIPIVPLYFAKQRPVVERDGTLIMVDDDRMPLVPGETPADAAGPLPHARLLSADRRDRDRRRRRSTTSSPRC